MGKVEVSALWRHPLLPVRDDVAGAGAAGGGRAIGRAPDYILKKERNLLVLMPCRLYDVFARSNPRRPPARRPREGRAVRNMIEAGPPPTDAGPGLAAGAAAWRLGCLPWLDGLLDLARDRGDAALARLVAGLMDDLAAAAEGRP